MIKQQSLSFHYEPCEYIKEKPVIAKGIIAIGQFGCGLITIAQFGIGLICLSQFSIAAFAIAQFAIAYSLIAQFGIFLSHGQGHFVKSFTELAAILLK